MKIKTFVINLEKSKERRKHVLAETSKYPCLDVELVSAVYGKELSTTEAESLFDYERFKRRYFRDPFPAEVGCTLSHRECYRRLLESKEKYALILEDDVCFLDPDQKENVLLEIAKQIPENTACVVTLARHTHYYPRVLYTTDRYSIYKVWMAFGTCAYLINREAAQILLATPKALIYADDYEYMNSKGIFVKGIYPTFAAGLSELGGIESELSYADRIYPEKFSFMDRLNYLLRNRKRGLLKVMGILHFRRKKVLIYNCQNVKKSRNYQ